jgi:oligopeptide transport system substrate-binding protein
VKKLIFILVALVLLISLAWTGCELTAKTGAVASPAGQTAGPVSGILQLADSDPTTLDPAVSMESTSVQYIILIYSGLVKLNDKLEPVPDIAESWTLDPAGTTYTFKLRQDVKFQNGKALTSNDFKYSWERAANPATGSQTAETYLGDILGVDDVISGKSSAIRGVETAGDYTLKVTIDAPKSYFLYKLSYPTTFAVDQDSVKKGAEWWRSPNNGTGPFKLADWQQGKSLKLVRNAAYYGEKAKVSAIQYSYFSGMAMDLYETGKIDVTGVGSGYIDTVMDQSGPFYKDLRVSSDLSITYIGFNCNQAPFNDAAIRKAFDLAIDKDKIIKLVYRDMEKRADGILPPGMPGYNSAIRGIGFDTAAARALIQASQYGDVSKLPEITLTTYGYGGAVGQLLQALVYQWQENLGVKVKIRQLETDRYFYNTSSEIDQMYLMSWSADYPHPQDFVDILFRSDASNNNGGYSNPQVDALIQKANATLNEPDSLALYQQAEQKIIDDAACLPLSFGMNYFLVKSYVQNYAVSPLGFALLQAVSISPH